ncbi:MAG: hypothetical protein OXQ89_07925 [Rhodospirillaceae bacterium]|nr:hypothetical protein [Rhodospirillaceae bacterium]
MEPHWEKRIPDIVIVRDEEIVDIFELKFAPHWYPDYQGDIHKLLHYNGVQHVVLDPVTGHWGDPLPISANCRLHFAVVGRSDSDAVRPENISDQVFLWYGRIGQEENEWGVCQGEQHNHAG